MSKVDWSSAPEGAEFYCKTNFYKSFFGQLVYFNEINWVPSCFTFANRKLQPCYEERPTKATGEHYQVVEKGDPVNNPKHYAIAPDVEAIDIIRASLTPEQFKGYLLGNFLKYRLRAGDKGDLQQDIDKSNWYKRELNK